MDDVASRGVCRAGAVQARAGTRWGGVYLVKAWTRTRVLARARYACGGVLVGSRWLLAHAYVDQDLCGGGEGGRAGRETGAHMAPVHLWLSVAPWVPPVVLSYYLSYYRTIGLK